MNPMTQEIIKLKLISYEFSKEVQDISNIILYDQKFQIWWGGLTNQHHSFKEGLSTHTREVIELMFGSMKTLNLCLDRTEVFLSALFHDIGKTYDYERISDEVYVPSSHKRNIHHISRSALIWSHAVSKYPELSDKYHDLVLHNILSHHGRREWGSPVAPNTQTAWLLHLCDGISARTNEYDKIDFVKSK